VWRLSEPVKPTAYGKAVTEEIIETISTYDLTIISGLAYGIDITAHKYCVQLNVPTIGVLGSGLGNIYPEYHQATAHKMMERGGLITEFSFETGPDAVNFPMRNRIVAGLCDVLVVIESGAKGGSMITAALANDYNKDVGAVPGRKMDKASAGCNFLIKNQQAHLLETGEDLIHLMGWNKKTQHQSFQTDLFVEMSDREQKIYRLIVETGEKDIDTLAYESKSTPGELASIFLHSNSKELSGPCRGKNLLLSVKTCMTIFSIVVFLAATACHTSKSASGTPPTPPGPPATHAKNVIFLIGDGMGLPQITGTMYMENNKSSFEKFINIGFHKSHSSDNLITDSAAGATAFASGVKTYNGAIGVDAKKQPGAYPARNGGTKREWLPECW
jgi:DNA protecting protein DprA